MMSKRLTSVIAVLVCSWAASAQNPRFAQVNDPFPDGMGAVFGAGDADLDGDIDLYTTVGIFLNTRGFFAPGPIMPPGWGPSLNHRSIAVADVTGDGRPDVVGGGGAGPTTTPAGVWVFVAPPPGGTQLTILPGGVSTNATLTEMCAADVDNDGDVDVIAASGSSGTPAWQLFLNNGTGGFTTASAAQWPAAPTAASWVAAGDFDGDGLIDAFASTSPGGGVWRKNLGGGVFGATTSTGSAIIADSGAVGDFDGDGDDDVFLVDVTGIEVLHAGSPAGLVAGTPAFGGILGPPPVALDFEGDGDADVIRSVVGVSGSASGLLQVRLGAPAGLGAAVTIAPADFAAGNPMPFPGVVSFDVENDGDLDIGLITGVGPPALIVNGGPNGFVVAPHPVPFGFNGLYASPRDIDGDGDADLIRATLANGVVSLVATKNDGRGNFGEPVPAGSYSALLLGRTTWADLDNDGDSDLFVATPFLMAATATALLNDGFGVFTPVATMSFTGPVQSIASGDFDGDNDVDVVFGRGTIGFPVATLLQPGLIRSLFTQSGVVSFALAAGFGTAEVVTDIHVFDAQPDGNLDLLVGTAGLGGVPAAPRFYLNTGPGVFLSLSIAGAAASSVTTADLNGDTLVDAVLGSQVWLQGPGGFAPAFTHATPFDQITLADLDLDGLPDLLDTGGRWYPGSPSGAFGAPLNIVPYAPGATFLVASPKAVPTDLDGDGDLDLAGMPNGSSGSFAIYSNLTRHAGRTSLVSQNSTVSVAMWGPPGAPWVLASSNPGAGPVALPPLGTLFLDPATIIVIASGSIAPNGRADLSAFLGSGLPGLTISWQALVGAALTNGFDTTVLP